MMPTPTPMPPAGPGLVDLSNINPTYRIWNFADDAVQLWNRAGTYADVIQVVVFVVIVFAVVVLVYRLISSLNESMDV